MRLTVFGGTEGVGRELVAQAIAAGHEVTLLVNGSTPQWTEERLTVIEGDASDFATVAYAVAASHAVVCALRHANGSRDDLLAR
ncbi:MAG TPA: NAD(P)H-binding protein, partial [Gaiellaceae bacterium]|nr:NAD(P)H-binding protein [Gaiellaceae bacterium]